MLIFLTAVGMMFTLRLKGLQFTRFFTAAKLTASYRRAQGPGNITPLQSLFSALGGMIGNGNIAGVATAIAIGGPGAVFWLWVSSFIAMVIVYAETLVFDLSGLPGWIPPLLPFSLALAILTWLVVIGGIKSIARTLEKITPLMVLMYFILGAIIIIHFHRELGVMLQLIVKQAFTPAGAVGGFSGASVLMALRYGVARGFYSNEAGTGSSAIMFSTAKTDHPVKQSLISMFGVFIDTLVGTLTAFIILITGVWSTGETSTALTTAAFAQTFGRSGIYFVFAASFLFGYSTLIAWCFYGEQCFVYIWGTRLRKMFRWTFCVVIAFGFLEPELVWSLADILNASIVIVNVTALVFLIKYVVKITSQTNPNKKIQTNC
jgi:AGCS family alanine or glycine:cation symporter